MATVSCSRMVNITANLWHLAEPAYKIVLVVCVLENTEDDANFLDVREIRESEIAWEHVTCYNTLPGEFRNAIAPLSVADINAVYQKSKEKGVYHPHSPSGTPGTPGDFKCQVAQCTWTNQGKKPVTRANNLTRHTASDHPSQICIHCKTRVDGNKDEMNAHLLQSCVQTRGLVTMMAVVGLQIPKPACRVIRGSANAKGHPQNRDVRRKASAKNHEPHGCGSRTRNAVKSCRSTSKSAQSAQSAN